MGRAERGLARIALDLHDGPLQDLAAVGLHLNTLRRALEGLPADTARVTHELDKVQQQLGNVEATLRAVAMNGDASLDTSTVAELVHKEVALFGSRSRAAVDVDLLGDVEPATASQAIVLQRILREALANVARHSRASKVQISIVESEDVIYLRITDNGIGFEPTANAAADDGRIRLGLAGMERRLELIGGLFTIASQPGGPTSVTAAIKRWRPQTAPSRGAARADGACVRSQ